MIRVYRYGILPPTGGAALVREQMRLAHRYQNRLIEIENGRRDAQRTLEIESGLHASLEAATAAEMAVQQALAEKAPSSTIKALKAAAKEAKAALYAVRKALRERADIVDRRVAIDEIAHALHKNAREHCGVYWGTYLLIEAAVEAAIKATPLWDGTKPNDVKFVRWSGEGSIGVQIQGGLSTDELTSDTRVRLVPAPPRIGSKADPNSRRSQTRREMTLSMRVGSDEKRQPIWAEFPLLQHRSFLPGSVVKAVAVHLRLIGPREEWCVCFTLDMPEQRVSHGEGLLAFHIGWRTIQDEGVRVATYAGESETPQFFMIPEEDITAMERPDELRGTRDRNFNRALKGFRSFLARETAPEWVLKSAATSAHWRSANRLASLVRAWAKEAGVEVHHPDYLAWTEPTEDAWTLRDLAIWRYHDHHLWEWETSLRVKLLRHRRETYRVFAARLARTYRVLVIEDLNLAPLAAIPEPGLSGEVKDNPFARAKRVRAAPGELRQTVIQAFVAAGGVVVTIPPVTSPCSVCGQKDAWDRAETLEHTCSQCGSRWDQDANSVRNSLAYAVREGLHARQVEKAEPTKGGRWAKAKAKKAESAVAG